MLTARARRAAALALASLAACTGAAPSSGLPAPGPRGPLGREERVLLTSFADITGVAVSRRLVFVASALGLGVYDRQFGTWLPPLAAGDALPSGRVTFMAADPSVDGVWVGGFGSVAFYQPSVDIAVRASVPGTVDYILFDRRDPAGGAFVRSGGQWSRVTSTGFVVPVTGGGDLPAPADQIRPPTLRELYREFPSLQGFERLLTRGDGLRSWPVSAGARSPDRSAEVWLGTAGDGLYKVDPNFLTSDHLPFGLLERGSGALARAADGVWVAGDGGTPGARGGITFARADLQEWRWLDAPAGVPLDGARAYDLDVREGTAWIATGRGLARLRTRAAPEPRDAADAVLWTGTTGLPDDRALAVLARADGAWVGTARGLAFVRDQTASRSASPASVGHTLATGTPVRALLATGDTLWIGSDAGLLLLEPGNDSLPRRPAAAALEPRLSQPVRALAWSDSVVAIATADDIVRLHLATGRPLPRLDAVNVAALGGITALAMDGRTLWVGGARGVLVLDRGTGASRLLANPDGLAGETRDLLLAPDYAWVATRNGVVRLRRLRDGTVR